MKTLHSKILKSTALAATFFLAVTACNDDFLDVPRTDTLSVDNFPSKPEDLDFLLFDLYGRLRNSYYNSENFTRFGMTMSHETDQAYIGAEFNFHAQNSLLASNGNVNNLWNGLFENIAKANAFLAAVEGYRQRNPNVLPEVTQQLTIREGQARFLRAQYYFQAVAFFGESFIIEPGDANKMGVPLFTQVATSIEETARERAPVGEVWNFVIQDLETAEQQLDGITFTGGDRARAGIWAVKGMLGKMYLYTRQYDKAKIKLKEVIDNGGKKLVPYATYQNMFNGTNEFNEESIFELNYNASRQGEWNTAQQTSSFIGIFTSPAFMNADRKYDKNGFGNLFVHDKNLGRMGYTYPDPLDENQLKDGEVWKADAVIKATLAPYLANAKQVRESKAVDPRLYVSALQPYYDSIYIQNKPRPIVKNTGEGVNLTKNYTWSVRKNVATNRGIWSSDQGPAMDGNIYVLRLADVYLMYAEAAIATGDSPTGLEYVNKVKRRAYSFPVDAASPVDYPSLTAKTLAPDPVLGNDPLKYERFTELFLEGQWWFDIVRWRLGPAEAAYYQRVGSGPLQWNDRAYAMPIPESEINANAKMKQNPGY